MPTRQTGPPATPGRGRVRQLCADSRRNSASTLPEAWKRHLAVIVILPALAASTRTRAPFCSTPRVRRSSRWRRIRQRLIPRPATASILHAHAGFSRARRDRLVASSPRLSTAARASRPQPTICGLPPRLPAAITHLRPPQAPEAAKSDEGPPPRLPSGCLIRTTAARSGRVEAPATTWGAGPRAIPTALSRRVKVGARRDG
jgi:hypothetical protein